MNHTTLDTDEPRWRRIGVVTKPHGLKGDVVVYLLTDFPERYQEGRTYSVLLTTGVRLPLSITRLGSLSDRLLVHFNGIDTVEDADRLRSAYIEVPYEDRMPLDPDTYYIDDIIGLQVWTDTGEYVGDVDEVISGAAYDLYRTGDVLIPAISQFVESIDIDAKRIVIHPIPGLLPGT